MKTPTDTPTLSVVVPTKNGAATIPGLLDALDRQRAGFGIEVIIVDSGSTDGTIELARDRVDRLVTTPAEDFNHGLTRNLGIEVSRGELVTLLVQDALPASETLLQDLAAPLLSDPQVAGSFARQRPRVDATPIARHYLSRWVAASDHGRTVALEGPGQFQSLSPEARLERCAFDNVCSCIRRSVWERTPFRETPIAEDLAWAKEVLLAGHHLVYVPEAVVCHSHDRAVGYELVRTRALHQQLVKLFGLRTIPSLSALLRAVAGCVSLHVRLEHEHPRHLARALGLAVAWPLGQYLGGRDGVRATERRHAVEVG